MDKKIKTDKEDKTDTEINSDKNSPQEEGKKMDAVIKRHCTPSESLAQSLKEMKLMREGKTKKRTWDDLKKELKKEN